METHEQKGCNECLMGRWGGGGMRGLSGSPSVPPVTWRSYKHGGLFSTVFRNGGDLLAGRGRLLTGSSDDHFDSPKGECKAEGNRGYCQPKVHTSRSLDFLVESVTAEKQQSSIPPCLAGNTVFRQYTTKWLSAKSPSSSRGLSSVAETWLLISSRRRSSCARSQ